MGTFVSGSLIEPMALKRAGIPLHHLSNWLHGLSNTRFAAKWLNPMVTAAENRYLAERIVRRPGFADSLVTLRKRLGDNKVIGVRASDGARMVLDLPFLAGRLSLATGPLELAMLTGAKILPMFVIETEPNVFEVQVGAEISLTRDGERKETIAKAAREYVRRLEPYVIAYPDRWTGWDSQAHLAREDDGDEILEIPGLENAQWRAFRRLGPQAR
jgi:predicted LPLAT superfamily acyltransferase